MKSIFGILSMRLKQNIVMEMPTRQDYKGESGQVVINMLVGDSLKPRAHLSAIRENAQ